MLRFWFAPSPDHQTLLDWLENHFGLGYISENRHTRALRDLTAVLVVANLFEREDKPINEHVEIK